jgi:hypothetical protein
MRSRHGRGGFARLRWLWAKSPSYSNKLDFPCGPGNKTGRESSPPAVATQRTTVREARQDLTLSTTTPETDTAVDGLQSVAPRSAAKGSDDMAAMERFLRPPTGSFAGAAAGDRRRRWGQNGKCRGEREERLMFVWLWRDSYPRRPTQVSQALWSCHVACYSFDCRFWVCFVHWLICHNLSNFDYFFFCLKWVNQIDSLNLDKL